MHVELTPTREPKTDLCVVKHLGRVLLARLVPHDLRWLAAEVMVIKATTLISHRKEPHA